MAHDSAAPSGFGAGAVAGGGAIEASIWNALPHVLPLLIFPLIVNAAMQVTTMQLDEEPHCSKLL